MDVSQRLDWARCKSVGTKTVVGDRHANVLSINAHGNVNEFFDVNGCNRREEYRFWPPTCKSFTRIHAMRVVPTSC